MINYPVIKQTIREVYQQPPIVMVALIIIAVFFLLVFTFKVEFEGDVIVSMSFFGLSFDETKIDMGYDFMTSIYNFLKHICMFLLFLQGSTLFVDTLKDPLLGIFLTKPVSRAGLLLSRYAGQIIAIFALLLISGIGITLILYFKMNGTVFLTPIYLSLLVSFIFITMFTFMGLLSIIFENSLAVAAIGILIYFALAPIILFAEMGGNQLVYLAYILPPVWKFLQQETNIINGNTINPDVFALALLYIVVYITLSIILFNRKDIT